MESGDVEYGGEEAAFVASPTLAQRHCTKRKRITYVLSACGVVFILAIVAHQLLRSSSSSYYDNEDAYYRRHNNSRDFCDYLQPLPSNWSVLNGPASPQKKVKLAFLGDSGANADSVWKLTLKEKAYAIVHQGDFDYHKNATVWKQSLARSLPDSFPLVEVFGNHDVDGIGFEALHYQAHALERLLSVGEKIDYACEGYPGIRLACNIKGVLVLQMAVNTACDKQIPYSKWLDDTLGRYSSFPLKICSWHKGRKLLQVGNKGDEVSLETFEICRRHGAIIIAGHEHSYERTHPVFSFQSLAVVPTNFTSEYRGKQLAAPAELVKTRPGVSMVVVNGLGGKDIRSMSKLGLNPWWSAVYTSTQKAKFGSLFCTFENSSALCYFKNVDKKIVDSFVWEAE